MPSTYTPNLGLEQPATGSQTGTWGVTLNTMMSLIDSAVEGVYYPDLTGLSTLTLTTTNGVVSNGRQRVVHLTGLPTANVTVTVSPNTSSKVYLINNNMAGGFSATITQGTGPTVTIANNQRAIVYCDGLGTGASVFNILDLPQITSPTIIGTIAGNPTLPYANAKIDGNVSVSLAGLSTYTLDVTNIASGGNRIITFTGQAATSPCVVTISPNTSQKVLFVRNTLVVASDFSGSDIQFKQGSGRTATVPNGISKTAGILLFDGGGASANCDSFFTQLFQAGPAMAGDIPYWAGVDGVGLSGLAYGSAGPEVKAGSRWFETCPTSAPTDADIQDGQYSVWVDESINALTFRVRKSDGTYVTGTVALA